MFRAHAAATDRRDVVARRGVCGAAAALGANAVRGVVGLIAAASVASACAVSKPLPAPLPSVPPAVTPLVGVATVALQPIDAPGFAVDMLTARMREAFVRTSGADAVDGISVRAEIAACASAPCSDEQQARFRGARFIASVVLSKVGGVVLGSAQVIAGADELARVNASGAEAGVVVDELGWALGARFRSAVGGLPASAVDAPPAAAER